jgi:transposase
MYRLVLTSDEEHVLEQTCKTTPDRRLRDRSQAVLRAARGRARHLIAQDVGVPRTTVRLWLQSYRKRGLAGLKIPWAPGQPRRIPGELAPPSVEWVKGGPASCGLPRANWTYAELAAYLYPRTGIRGQETAMREFCQRQQLRPYRPTYRYLGGDPDRPAATQAALADTKKQPKRGSVSC